MLPSQFSPLAKRAATLTGRWPFHRERGCLEVVCGNRRLNETGKQQNQDAKVRPPFRRDAFRFAPLRLLTRRPLWWGQLVISPLWAPKWSFNIYWRKQGRIHTEHTSVLHNGSLAFSLPIVAMLSQLNGQPFGIPLSLPHYF